MIAKTKAKPIAMDLIKRSKDVQPRAELDDATVEEYAELLRANKREWPFPPVVVFDDGDGFWLASGFHRVAAAEIVDRASVMAEVHKGDQRDAILYAAGTNAEHGRRRSNEDKRFIVRRLLEDDEWSQRSARWIAERCRVTDKLVSSIKSELTQISIAEKRNGKEGKAETKDGRQYPANRKNLSTPKSDEEVERKPSGGTSFDPSEWETTSDSPRPTATATKARKDGVSVQDKQRAKTSLGAVVRFMNSAGILERHRESLNSVQQDIDKVKPCS